MSATAFPLAGAQAADWIPAQTISGEVTGVSYRAMTFTMDARTFQVPTIGYLEDLYPGYVVEFDYVARDGANHVLSITGEDDE